MKINNICVYLYYFKRVLQLCQDKVKYIYKYVYSQLHFNYKKPYQLTLNYWYGIFLMHEYALILGILLLCRGR